MKSELKYELITMAAIFLVAVVGFGGLTILGLNNPLFQPISGYHTSPFGMYAWAAAAISFVALLKHSKQNVFGSIMVSIITGWLYWPVFIYAVAKQNRVNRRS